MELPQAGHSTVPNRRRGRRWRASWGGLSIGCAAIAGFAAAFPGRDTVPKAIGQPIGIDPGWSLPGLVVDTGRVTGYLGVTLLIGTLAFWLLVWPSGRADRGLIGMVWVGLLFTAVSAPVGVAGSLAIAAAADVHNDLSTVLERPIAPLLARMAICAGLTAWLACHVPRRGTGAGDRAGGAELAGGAAGAVMVLSLVLTSVAARPGRLPIPAVVLTELHVLAAAGWVGGLAALAVAMVPRRDPAVLNATLGSFSWLSMACVTTLAVTGTIHAWYTPAGSRR